MSTSGACATLLYGISNLWVVGNRARFHLLPHNLQQGIEIWNGVTHVEAEIRLQWSLFNKLYSFLMACFVL